MNGDKVTDPKFMVSLDDFKDGELLLKAGKKRFARVVLE